MLPRSDKKELEELLNAAGTRLLRPPSSIVELLSLLDRTEDLLSKVEQSPGKFMHTALTPLKKALVAEDLLKHSYVDVKVGVASCISEITRITAPDAPYDDGKMKDVFQLIVSSFENMSNTSSRSHKKRANILKSVATFRSYIIMLDLECDKMIVEMFQHFLKGIRDHHAEFIFASMEAIMSHVIKESEDISPELLNPILATLERNNEAAVLPIAKKLAEKVIQSCADKLRPYLIEALKTSVDDYSEVVSSLCRENAGAGVLSNKNISKDEAVFEGENISEAKKQKQRSGRKRPGVSTNKDKALTEEGGSKNDGGSSSDSLDQTQKLVDASNKPAKNGPPSKKETSKKSGRVNKDKMISIDEVALKNETRSQGQTEKVQVDSLNKADGGSLSRKEDVKESGRVKPKPAKDVLKSSAKDVLKSSAKDVLKSSAREDDDKEIGTEQEKVTSPSFPVKSTKDGSNKEETPRITTKRKKTPATKKASEIKHGTDLVGSSVKILWPDDEEFYEGVIVSFDSGKHKVMYNDGEIEILNLRNEEWEFVDGGSSSDSLDQTQKLVDASNKPAKNGPPSKKETSKKSGRVNKDKMISIEEVALKNETRSQGQTEKVQVDSLNKADGGSLSRKEDVKESGRVKPKPAKDVLKSSAREDDDKEIGTEQEKVTSPRFPVKSTKDGSNTEETTRVTTKRKKTPATKKASEIEYGENLVGSNVKILWSDEQEFYEGVIVSFDSGKKNHKVLYNDGEIDILNLRNEEWEFVDDDPDHSDGYQDMQRKRKNKATPSSEASSKRAKMEKNSSKEVTVETREVSPSHFLFKIKSFSLLSQNGIDKYESTEFSAGDYKWKLIFYPNGEENENDDDDDIVVNLAVADTSSLPPRWEVNAVFSIFLYNQKSNNFLAMRGPTRRFHAVKTEWGLPKFISKKSLIDPSNGYLVKDSCVFGAEVFVVKGHGVVECLSMSGDEKPFHRSWKISQFSKLEIKWVSEKFIVGDHTWKMEIYPRGDGDQKGRSMSIFLHLVDCSLTPFHKVKANFTLKIKDQNNGEDWIETGNDWFASRYDSWGLLDFMSISDMNDPAKGYLVQDCCILEVEISVQAVAHSLIP